MCLQSERPNNLFKLLHNLSFQAAVLSPTVNQTRKFVARYLDPYAVDNVFHSLLN